MELQTSWHRDSAPCPARCAQPAGHRTSRTPPDQARSLPIWEPHGQAPARFGSFPSPAGGAPAPPPPCSSRSWDRIRRFSCSYTKCCILRLVDSRLKPIVWMGDSLGCVRAFPASARQDAGYQLDRVQRGLAPRDWRPMRSVGPGVAEVRIHAGGEYRVLYVARFQEAVYVLHAFARKARKTPAREISLGRERYRSLLREEGRK
jgi:phage-related protein